MGGRRIAGGKEKTSRVRLWSSVSRNNVKSENARNKMDGRWPEGYYLGTDWRTGSAWIGTSAGVIKASVIRRTGAHRRWDHEGVFGVRGTPWNRVPAAEEEGPEIFIEPLPEVERRAVPPAEDHRRLRRRIRWRKEHFVQHRFTAKCPGCRVLLSGAAPQRSHGRHTEECRKRMEKVLEETPEGRIDLKRARDRLEAERTRQAERILQEPEEQEHISKENEKSSPRWT